MSKVNLSNYQNVLSKKHQILRFFWQLTWMIFARPFPRSYARKWKIFLLKSFGAKLHSSSNVYSSVSVYAPWNLEMGKNSCLGPQVDCYNVDKIIIKDNASVSQKAFLCTASHNISDAKHSLITAPIIIEDQAWIGASVFIGMGVRIGQGAVVGATASVFKDVENWNVVGGNPSIFIKKRKINNDV